MDDIDYIANNISELAVLMALAEVSSLGRAHQEAKGYKGIAYFRDATKIIISVWLFS